MSDTVARTSSSPKVSDSPKLKQKWTTRVGTVVRRASKRFSIHKMHSQDQVEKTKNAQTTSADLDRTSSSTSSSSTSEASIAAGHVKSESAPAVLVTPPVQDKSTDIAPTEPTMSAITAPAPEQPSETHTHILLPAPVNNASSVVKSNSTPEPVLAQVNLDESMVEVVIPIEEEEEDVAAAPMVLSRADAEESDKGVRFAEDVHVIQSQSEEEEVAVPEPTMVEVDADADTESSTSEEDQKLLDAIVLPREEDAISIMEATSQPEAIKLPSASSKSTPAAATVTVVTSVTSENASSSSSSSSKKPSSTPQPTSLIFAIISGAIVSVGALAYAGVIAGLSVGGIVAGVGESIVSGWRRKRSARA